jgi:hypothetical protein
MCGAAVLVSAASVANATTLDLTITTDNAFSVYLSTSPTALGTLIGSGPAAGNDWQTPVTLSATLAPNETYFIEIIGTNWNTTTGYPQYGPGTSPSGNNPNALLGSFSLVGGGYVFSSNLSTTLLTNTATFSGVGASNNTSWTDPIGSPTQSYGTNGGNNIWTSAHGGPIAGISTSAQWIWSDPDNMNYADFVTGLQFVGNVNPTPLPGALPLLAGGLGFIGFVANRRKNRRPAALRGA